MTEQDIYIGALAHAIRLGKRPRPGMVMGGKVGLDNLDTETGEITRGERVEIKFTVTQELLDAAVAAINAQRVLYREHTVDEKMSIMPVNGQAIPEEVWNLCRRKP